MINDIDGGFSASFGDVNQDGLLDLLIPVIVPPNIDEQGFMQEGKKSKLHFNKSGSFSLFSGRFSDAQPNALFMQGNWVFEDVAASVGLDDSGWTRGGLLVDLNQDGWLDFIHRNIGERPSVYFGRCGEEHSLLVRIQQSDSNRFAIGAKVDVHFSDRTIRRWVLSCGISIASSAPVLLHFGFGEHRSIDFLRVAWPDGSESMIKDIDSNQILLLFERLNKGSIQ